MPLGKGLSALIPTRSGQVPQKTIEKINVETLEETGERISQIRVSQIQPNPDQPRRDFKHQEMEELINSIREYGIIQPLILTLVRHSSSEGGETSENFYQIIAGERRYRAAKFLNLTTVPAIIRSVGELEKLELSLIENIQRQDLNPMERARAYQRLIDQFNLTQDEVAKKMGKNRATIANSLRLLTLPEIIKQAIEEEKISEGHAKALLSLDNKIKQEVLLKRILGLGLTVRETEKLTSPRKAQVLFEKNLQFTDLEKQLSLKLGTKVRIRQTKATGEIIIEFYNQEDLKNLLEKLERI